MSTPAANPPAPAAAPAAAASPSEPTTTTTVAAPEPETDPAAVASPDSAKALRDQLSAAKARGDALEARLAKLEQDQGATIDARVSLVADARTVLGSSFDARGKTDAQIMAAIAKHLVPGMAAQVDANANDTSYLRAAYQAAIASRDQSKGSNSNRSAASLLDSARGDAATQPRRDAIDDILDLARGQSKPKTTAATKD